MTERISDLTIRSDVRWDGGPAKPSLYLGVLGLEYKLSFDNGRLDKNITNDNFTGKPSPNRLAYNYINRTDNIEEWTYSDGVLPVYIRFQPNLSYPIAQAALDDPAAHQFYDNQWVELVQPEVVITGMESFVDNTGIIHRRSVAITFVMPVLPPSSRQVKLSAEDGTTIYLARMR